MPMSTDVQGRALAVLNRVAQADWPDRFNLRKPFEKLLYSGSRTGFRLASERSAKQAKGPRKACLLYTSGRWAMRTWGSACHR